MCFYTSVIYIINQNSNAVKSKFESCGRKAKIMIFIVEDDENIREMESYALRNSGYQVTGFERGSQLFESLSILPELILLDIMLPGEDGLEILKRLRSSERTAGIPIILVTAKTTELDKVRGLDMGADDYIAKPFGIMELVSRVKALLRRAGGRENTELAYGEIKIHDDSRKVTVSGEEIELTFKEYELLKYLLSNINRVMPREKILSDVWGFDYEGETRTVDMHIKTLRQKLGEAGSYIKTVRSVGYKLGE